MDLGCAVMHPISGLPTLTLYGIKYSWMSFDPWRVYRLCTPNIIIEINKTSGIWQYTIYAINPESRIIITGQWFDLVNAVNSAGAQVERFTEEEILWKWTRTT